ncbi:alpha/beta fold hydrolase [Geodermatophilus sp. SYSU D00779]
MRGAPASTTTTDRRERASTNAPFSPAAPPPTTTTSYSFLSSSVTVTTSAATVRRTAPMRQGSLPYRQSHGALPGCRGLADVCSAPAAGHGTTYVVCDQDRAVPPVAQEAMASGADRVERLPSSHWPVLSVPGRLAEVLERAAAES